MADQNEQPAVFQLNVKPGIQRDGTDFDSRTFVDGQWVRFQRGRPRKMGGYRSITDKINGPIRLMNTWSRQSIIQITAFSPYGVEAVQVDRNGTGQAIYDRTPSGFATNVELVWQAETMYDSAAGSTKTLLLAHAAPNLQDIDSGVVGDVYYGDASSTGVLTAIGSPAQVSGGILSIPPYLVLYGSDGLVMWSNANEPRNFTTGDATTARVTGSKIVKGLPIRGQGASPSALLWSLDSVIRMSYIGGNSIFKFDATTNGASILSSSCIIEYDGIYYWIGLDRFMQYNGRVQELPNVFNSNWFFDSLNYAQRQKVFAHKVPRFGEIWWFFPKDDATECTHAVIFNVRENYWYDVALGRSAAAFSQVFRYPVLSDTDLTTASARVNVADVVGFVTGDTVTGATSGASGKAIKIIGNNLFVDTSSAFTIGETISGSLGGSSTINTWDNVNLYSLWLHEYGVNKIYGDQEIGISSFVETCNFGFPGGGIEMNNVAGPDRWTRITRVEPDFVQVGTIDMEIVGRNFARGDDQVSAIYPITETTDRIDLREQRREIRLRFTNNQQHGYYEMGNIILHLEQGDVRV